MIGIQLEAYMRYTFADGATRHPSLAGLGKKKLQISLLQVLVSCHDNHYTQGIIFNRPKAIQHGFLVNKASRLMHMPVPVFGLPQTRSF